MNKKFLRPVRAEFVSIADAALMLGISSVSIKRFINEKRLRRYKVRNRTLLKIADVRKLAVVTE
jgi:hypothetical protein